MQMNCASDFVDTNIPYRANSALLGQYCITVGTSLAVTVTIHIIKGLRVGYTRTPHE